MNEMKKKIEDVPQLGLIMLPPMRIRVRPRMRDLYLSPQLPGDLRRKHRCQKSKRKTR